MEKTGVGVSRTFSVSATSGRLSMPCASGVLAKKLAEKSDGGGEGTGGAAAAGGAGATGDGGAAGGGVAQAATSTRRTTLRGGLRPPGG